MESPVTLTKNETKKTLELGFLGEKIAFRFNNDPELVAEIVQLASEKLTEAYNRSKGAAPHKVALLALLDLSEDLIKSKRRFVSYKEKALEKATRILKAMDASGSPEKST